MRKSLRKLKEKTIEKIHQYCTNKFCWYKFWDEHPWSYFIHWLIFFIFIAGMIIFLPWVSTVELWKADIVSTSVTVISFPAPTDLTATAVSSSRIDLAWSSVSGAVSYKVYREGLFIGSSTATFYSDTGLNSSTNYSYTVLAVNVFGGKSEQSSSVLATTQSIGGGGGAIYVPPEEEVVEEEVEEVAEEEKTVAEKLAEIPIPVLEKPIKEMTIAEIKKAITEIVTVINQLKALLAKITATVPAIPTEYKFEKTLKYGQTLKDVEYLQEFLKAQGTEIYPEGIVSGWFGPLTKAAVIRFQEKYVSDILAPWGLTKGTGLVGSTTRAKLNTLLGK